MIALARPSLARLARTPRAWIPIALWVVFLAVYAIALRRSEAPTDRLLLGVFAPLALPLLVLSVLGAAAGPEGIAAQARRMQLLGASGFRAGLASALVSAVASAALASAIAIVAVLIGHGASDPPLARDALTSAWVSALGAAAWSGWLGLGSTVGKQGWGRGVSLILAWLLADAEGAAVLSPHAHVRSLLGGARAADLSQRASSVALVVIAALTIALTALRCRKRAS